MPPLFSVRANQLFLTFSIVGALGAVVGALGSASFLVGGPVVTISVGFLSLRSSAAAKALFFFSASSASWAYLRMVTSLLLHALIPLMVSSAVTFLRSFSGIFSAF